MEGCGSPHSVSCEGSLKLPAISQGVVLGWGEESRDGCKLEP